MFWNLRRTRRQSLDAALFDWRPKESFTLRHLLDGGVSILGRVGSGKTSSSGKILGRAVVRYRNSSGLICCAKPEDAPMWREIFRDAGRAGDLVEFDADGSKSRLNFLAEAALHGGQAREVTRCLMTINESLRSGDSKGRGENSEFWAREEERMIYNAIEPLRMAGRPVGASELQAFITTAAFSQKQLSDPVWRQGFHCQTIGEAHRATKSATDEFDLNLATDYWYREVPHMDERTRGNILTGVLGLLHVLNSGLVRSLISTTTNIRPKDMLQHRKWVLVNVPPARFGDAGAVINAGWKYLTQREVLRREAKPDDAFHVIWCDEAQQFANSFDSAYLAQCRSHLGCVVFLTQSLHSYLSAMKGDRGVYQAKALLGNFGHHILHALGDFESAEWASEKVGKRLETMIGGSMPAADSLLDELIGRTRFTGSFSTQYEPILQPNVFMNGLRTGGRRNGYVCDAIVMKSGEPFRCGENFLQVAFSQR